MRGRKARTVPVEARKTVAYVRVSTEDQARDGVSLDAQRARIAAYCTAMELRVDEFIEDAGESAKSLKRPGLQRIRDGIRAREISSVVVLKLDRITRSVRDLATLLDEFQASSAALVSVSEHLDSASAAGRMVVNMLGVVAQWERETIAERTSFALAHKRRTREAYGRTPFGFRREGNRLIEERSEQRALEEARAMHAAGASYRQIAIRLTEIGAKPHRGAKWHASSVRAMLLSRMNAAAA